MRRDDKNVKWDPVWDPKIEKGHQGKTEILTRGSGVNNESILFHLL